MYVNTQFEIQQLMMALNNKNAQLVKIQNDIQVYSQSNPVYVQQTLMPAYNSLVNEITQIQRTLQQLGTQQQNRQMINRQPTPNLGFGTQSGFLPGSQNLSNNSFGDVNEDLVGDDFTPPSYQNKTLASCYEGFTTGTREETVEELQKAKNEIKILKEKIMQMENAAKIGYEGEVVTEGFLPFFVTNNKAKNEERFDGRNMVNGLTVKETDVEEFKSEVEKKAEEIYENIDISLVKFTGDIPSYQLDVVSNLMFSISSLATEHSDVFQPDIPVLKVAPLSMLKPEEGLDWNKRTEDVNKKLKDMFNDMCEFDIRTIKGTKELLNYITEYIIEFNSYENIDSFDVLQKTLLRSLVDKVKTRINHVYRYLIGRGEDLIVGELDKDTFEIIADEIMDTDTGASSPRLDLHYDDLQLILKNVDNVVVEFLSCVTIESSLMEVNGAEPRLSITKRLEDNTFFLYSNNLCNDVGLFSKNNFNITKVLKDFQHDKFAVSVFSSYHFYGILEGCMRSLEGKVSFTVTFVDQNGMTTYRAIKGGDENKEYMLIKE